ncbi:histidine triad nucleotide-binding protein 3-like protein [Dermatophagoides farinae]|nr:histidine triad nucleotide-binding protein 3-like protein [Dermatophagoides farinae]
MCIFCGHENLSILSQNDQFMLIKDIKPATAHHYLVIPKEHYSNIKYLNRQQIPMIEDMKQMGLDFMEKNVPEFDRNNLRLGFHWAPFNSIDHIHLHLLYPYEQMNWLQNLIFRPNSYWFIEVDEGIKYLQSR